MRLQFLSVYHLQMLWNYLNCLISNPYGMWSWMCVSIEQRQSQKELVNSATDSHFGHFLSCSIKIQRLYHCN